MEQLKLLLENSIGNLNPLKLVLPTNTGLRIININQIIFCTSDSNYTNIKIYNNDKVLVSKTLKSIEEMLPQDTFFRVHKSTLVNLNYILSVNHRNECSITLQNGDTLEVAQRRINDLEDTIRKKYSLTN